MEFCEKQAENDFESEIWYSTQTEEAKYVFRLILKYHKYFSSQDRKYRWIIRMLKVIILTLAMASTIILGLKTVIPADAQIVMGLLFSSFVTFLSAIASYFNFEEYWMRNIRLHIELNINRDNYILEAKAGRLKEERVHYYKGVLEDLHKGNIAYWEKAIKRV